MKVKKSSWHYRFLVWDGFYPEYIKTASGYYGTIALLITHIILGGFAYYPIKYLIKRYHPEPVEFIDDKDNKENIE